MTVGAQVHLHPVDISREVRTVIEIEATQEILVGLAASRMLRSDHARDRLQQFGNAQQRANQKVGTGDGALTCCMRNTDLRFAAAEHDDVVGRRL